jgi:phosphodiesterase/alkaline phosphatase D-like protein
MRRMRFAAAIVLVACGLLGLGIASAGRPTPASAASTAAPPTPTTGSASKVAQSSATVSGTVNPQGTDTHYYFQYGTTTAYGAKTASTDAGPGTADVPVSADLTGLNSSTTYHYQLVAVNSAGDTTFGADQMFTTTTPPAATTGSAGRVTRSSATLNGTVDPKGQATTYYFRYGTTTSYGLQTSPADAGSGSGTVAVHQTISGLTGDTTYHYQLVATNAGGTSFGTDQTLTSTSSQAVVLGHEGFVSPGSVVGVELGCFHGTSRCTGHITMTHNGTTIAQRDYSIAADSGGFQNMTLNSTGKSDLGQNRTFHLLPVTVNVTASSGQKLSYVIHLARWVWH